MWENLACVILFSPLPLDLSNSTNGLDGLSHDLPFVLCKFVDDMNYYYELPLGLSYSTRCPPCPFGFPLSMSYFVISPCGPFDLLMACLALSNKSPCPI
jgi:hypothetical protein